MTTTISACLIVKNEYRQLRRCLESIQGICSEIIVVDTGSTDKTVELAKSLGAKVFHFDWVDDFSVARNYALSKATGEWILSIDADEFWWDQNPAFEESVFEKTSGIRVKVINLLKDGQEESPQVRLFKNAGYTYIGRVHEQISPSILKNKGSISESEIRIMHDGYLNENVQTSLEGSEQVTSRIERNHLLLQKSLIEHPKDPYLWFQLGMTYFSASDFEKSWKALLEAETFGIKKESDTVRRKFHFRRAQMLLRNDETEQALKEATAGYEALPGPDVAYVALACAGILQKTQLVKYWGERYLRHAQNPQKIKEVTALLKAMNLVK